MRLLVYEHPCRVRHGIIDDGGTVPEGQSALVGSAGFQTPEYDYKIIAAEDPEKSGGCAKCGHLEAGNRCRGNLRKELAADEVAKLPEKIRRLENALSEVTDENIWLQDELRDAETRVANAEGRIEDLEASLVLSDTVAKICREMIRDIELRLSQIANRSDTPDLDKYPAVTDNLAFLRDLVFEARKKMIEAKRRLE